MLTQYGRRGRRSRQTTQTEVPHVDTGMVRKIDDLGRIVVPAETRRLFNIREGDELAISIDGDAIIIRKLEATCTFCGSTKDVASYKGKGLCLSCRRELT
ncbi:MAG: AbrB/MazE/SpoVT family DNA-binding domain-containing protein [Acidimicrobiia bacterium]|nr:AbrB/MazE/SpoVT family DNA-binding domain-containing protein [Acidimicrobiia bacterium]NNF68206.1 AbrB/MazE/SpoVT family DNA-binding domain-containing protein [Acidimicrobiia bacterium]NNK92058.1 AbrB/MazE/SpoVT family DNA-binding domain-containing protein [Acidimicrobiia bacterium]